MEKTLAGKTQASERVMAPTLDGAYAQPSEYQREDILVHGDREVWAWVAGLISEDESYRGMDWAMNQLYDNVTFVARR
jgi:hypothetical protein